MKVIEKIKNIILNNFDTILFVLIIGVVCFVYNLNSQSLNFIFGKGTSLVYSYDAVKNNDYKNEIALKLNELNIKYRLIEEEDISEYEEYDNSLKKIGKIIVVSIPVRAEKSTIPLMDEISMCVFKNFEGSKLVSIRPLNHFYHSSSTFNGIIFVILISFLIWIVLLFTFKFNQTKDKLVNIFKIKQKTTHESKVNKNFKYYIKKLFIDDDKIDDDNTSLTKEIVSTIVFVLVSVVVIRYFIGELRWIPSGSMRPTIVEKDRVFVEKLNYPTKKEIKRGDILVFYPPSEVLSNSPLKILARLTGIFCKDIAYIKRVVGMPGDDFEIKYLDDIGQYRVFINNKPLYEPYISSNVSWTPCNKNMFCGPFKIPDKKYFMMGDNRNNSQDSRFIGLVDENRIIGRANFMFYPLRRINVLNDKYFTLQKNPDEKDLYILDRY